MERLYKPNNEECLSRYSSTNFSEKEIGEPILDTIVEPGDLLYFPRGTIHQGDTYGFDQHSLHITLSVYQKNSWADFLEKLIPNALQKLIKNDVQFRTGMPLNYLSFFGFVRTRLDNGVRDDILQNVKRLLDKVVEECMNIDETADELAKSHIHDYLPPFLNHQESIRSVYGGGEKMTKNGTITNPVEIKLSTYIRLTRGHSIRLVHEDNSYRIYYSTDNSKEYHEYELQYLELDEEFVPSIEKIIATYPQYMKVKNLPIEKSYKKKQIVRDLWEKGLVLPKKPLS